MAFFRRKIDSNKGWIWESVVERERGEREWEREREREKERERERKSASMIGWRETGKEQPRESGERGLLVVGIDFRGRERNVWLG